VDLDVLAWGRIVRDMSASFDRYWNDELAYPVQTLLTPEDLAKLRQKAAEQTPAAADPSRVGVPQQTDAAPVTVPVTASNTVLPDVTMTAALARERAPMDLRRVTLTWAPSRLMVDKPDKIGPDEDEADASDTVVDGLLALMLQAKQDILIISPYFVPGAEMMKTFAQARARGVRIRVLTNSLASNDAPAAHAGYARYRRDLLGMGIELHEMRATEQTAGGLTGSGSGSRGMWLGSSGGGSKGGASRASLHSKAVIIDARLAIIGSMNLDLRSKNLNSEVALLIRSAALSREAIRLVEGTFAQGAYRVELADGKLLWRAPPGASYPDTTDEPEAGTRLKFLVKVLGPLAPDEML
jgi:putative cardiolipin synthase